MSKDILLLEGVQELIEKGKKRGILTYNEIMNSLQGVELSPDQIDDIYERLANVVLNCACVAPIRSEHPA